MEMKQIKLLVAIAVLSSILSGCGPAMNEEAHHVITMANMTGQSKLRKVIEYFNDNLTWETADLSSIRLLCDAYLALADYRKTRHCLDQYSDKLARRRADPDDVINETSEDKTAKFVLGVLPVVGAFVDDSPTLSYANLLMYLLRLEADYEIELGNYAQAIQHMNKAYQLIERAEADDNYRFILDQTMGLAHAHAGNRKEAKQYASRIDGYKFEMLGMVVADVSEERNNAVARIYMAIGDFEAAKKVLQRTEKDSTDAWRAFEVTLSAATVAATATMQADIVSDSPLGAAIVLAGEVIASQDKLDYDDEAYKVANQLYRNFLTTKIAFETGDLAAARSGYDAWLAHKITRNFPGLHYVVLHDRGRISLRDGNTRMALDLFKRAIDVIEAQRSTVVTEAGRIGFVGNKQQVYADMVKLLIGQGRAGDAFAYAERAKARALIDLLASKQQFSEKRFGSNANRAIASLGQAEAHSFVFTRSKVSAQGDGVRKVEILAKKGIEEASPELASLIKVRAPDVARLQALVGTDETLVEFYGAGNALFVFVLTRDKVQAAVLDARDIAGLITEFRAQVGDRRSQAYRESGRRLYDRLLFPVAHALKSPRLTIVPHGPLHYVPFAALHDGHNYLIDQYTIRVLPSASVLEYLPEPARAVSRDLLVFGNPDLNDPKLDLPGAQQEALAISKGRGAEILLRARATETAAKNLSGDFRHLHFATHGSFNPEQPLRSALLLRPDEYNDGMLTVSEIYDLTLSADLVTLSACETALGETANGDDVMGFTRGLLFAGARSIVSTLWPVPDKATSRLMQRFYRDFGEAAPADALRRAQQEIKSRNTTRHPFYWAAFQLTGVSE